MRSRTWVLYYSRVWNNFYISQDEYTPFITLRGLDHCHGVYKTKAEAADAALKKIKYWQDHWNAEAKRMKREKKEKIII